MGAKRFHQVEIPASVERVFLLADNDPGPPRRSPCAASIGPTGPCDQHRVATGTHERLGAAPDAEEGLQGMCRRSAADLTISGDLHDRYDLRQQRHSAARTLAAKLLSPFPSIERLSRRP